MVVPTPVKLTLGEIAFAVATVDSYERTVGLIRTQLEVERTEDALLLIQASAQSLHARDLALTLTPKVELAPPLIDIGQVFARSSGCCAVRSSCETEPLRRYSYIALPLAC